MKSSDDLQQLHSAANDHFMARLFRDMPGLRGGASQVSPPTEALAGGASVPTDAPGQAGQGGDIEPDQRPIA